MEVQTILQSVADSGLGVASFVVLIYFGVKAAKFGKVFVENHLVHIQGSLDKLTDNSTQANVKLDEQTLILHRLDKTSSKK